MAGAPSGPGHRVLIISSHALFGQGLRSLLRQRGVAFEVIGLVSTVDEAVPLLESRRPDTVIVDYDDETINREEIFTRVMEGEGQMRVVLLSLKEGKEGREAVVYDRRTMAAAQMEDWLEGWVQPVPAGPKPQEPARRKRSADMKHLVAVVVFVIILTVGLGLVLTPDNLLPLQASLQAQVIDNMFSVHFWAIAFLFSLIVGFMVYSVVVFRRREGDDEDGPHIKGNTALEMTWTMLPFIAVVILAFWGSSVLAETRRVATDALEVDVIGQQWSWRFEYPQEGIISPELVLPVNRQALLRLSSLDIIHSFWVPEFRVKQDAIPGGEEMVRDLRVTPTELGNYTLMCAELCGLGHSEMLASVRVVDQAQFEAWVAEQQTAVSDDPVIRGQAWSQQYGCTACHSIDGSAGIGPTWKGIWGTQRAMEDGASVLVDEAYLIESIRNPGVKISAGFQNVMPAAVGGQLNDEQIADLIELIKSLQ